VSDHLTYRDIRPDDWQAMHRIVSHWSVVRQLGRWPWPAQEAFTQSRCQPPKGDGFVWAICRDAQVVGSIGISDADMGYMLDPAVQGQGIATAAATAAIDRYLAITMHDVIVGSTWVDNPASARVLEKLGFVHWQTRYVQSVARGYPELVHHRRLTRSNWQRLRTVQQ